MGQKGPTIAAFCLYGSGAGGGVFTNPLLGGGLDDFRSGILDRSGTGEGALFYASTGMWPRWLGVGWLLSIRDRWRSFLVLWLQRQLGSGYLIRDPLQFGCEPNLSRVVWTEVQRKPGTLRDPWWALFPTHLSRVGWREVKKKPENMRDPWWALSPAHLSRVEWREAQRKPGNVKDPWWALSPTYHSRRLCEVSQFGGLEEGLLWLLYPRLACRYWAVEEGFLGHLSPRLACIYSLFQPSCCTNWLSPGKFGLGPMGIGGPCCF